VLVVSGRDEEGLINDIPEVYTPGAGWASLTEELTIPLYPYMFFLPDGRLFYAGPGNPTRTFEVDAQTWAIVGSSQISGGSAVMYAPGKVLKSGGNDPAIARTVIMDITQGAPSWQEVVPMAFQRRRHNLTVLPDGKVLVMGGTRVGDDEGQAVYAAELWDPSNGTWTTMASMQVARMYHLTALLLPDGRVHSAGGNGKLSADAISDPHVARQREATDTFETEYARRAGMRGTVSRGPRSTRLRRTRYIGLARVHLGHILTAVGLNALRLGEWWLETVRAQTCITPFPRLMTDTAAA
jgi:hypothetical protein